MLAMAGFIAVFSGLRERDNRRRLLLDIAVASFMLHGNHAAARMVQTPCWRLVAKEAGLGIDQGAGLVKQSLGGLIYQLWEPQELVLEPC